MILDQWRRPANTDNTVTDCRTFFEELDRVTDREYVIDDEEFTEGLRSVGMAVDRLVTPSIGTMSVSGPNYRSIEG
ncbi:IclR family transcriptional regulator C-terminal domain-containing protein [Natrinema sp. 74]|uniref:IclR family transcriptional regulator domain-containing protein n=1 Tax=Natrinema sp. 74 TaxID=3384159 RepID=UPI0038D481AB